MAETNERMSMTMKAAADLSANRYQIMRFAGERLVNVASHAAAAATLSPAGILENTPTSGQNATITYAGITKVMAGGSLTVNTWFTNNGSGRAAAVASGDNAVGIALTGASADGDVITARIFACTGARGPFS